LTAIIIKIIPKREPYRVVAKMHGCERPIKR